MRKFLILLVVVAGAVYADAAMAILTCSNGTCTDKCKTLWGQSQCFTTTDNCYVEEGGVPPDVDIPGCVDSPYLGVWRYWVNEGGYISTKYVSSCGVCATGYTRTQKTATMKNCSINECILDGCLGYADATYTYYDCDCNATTCAEIEDWTELGNGYDKRPVYACQSGQCLATTSYKYRCSFGYWGTSNATGTSGCTKCPQFVDDTGRAIKSEFSSDDVYGTSSPYDNSDITGCYIPNDVGKYKDTYGDFGIGNIGCYYKS